MAEAMVARKVVVEVVTLTKDLGVIEARAEALVLVEEVEGSTPGNT